MNYTLMQLPELGPVSGLRRVGCLGHHTPFGKESNNLYLSPLTIKCRANIAHRQYGEVKGIRNQQRSDIEGSTSSPRLLIVSRMKTCVLVHDSRA